jgi:regulator of protease activity HflC (stomatin/prohibitin superfamily)
MRRLLTHTHTQMFLILLVVPLLDQYVSVRWNFGSSGGDTVRGYFIPTNTLLFDPPQLKCTTKDQITVEIDLILEFHVADVRKAVFEVSNPFVAIETVIKTNLYETIRALSLEQCDPATITNQTRQRIADKCGKYGIAISSLLVEQVTIPKKIQDATINTEANRRHALAEVRFNIWVAIGLL